VKLIRTQKEKRIFHLGRREKQLLLALLDRYPLVPPAYQRLSKSIPSSENETNQRLLDEALAEHRQGNKKHLWMLLQDGQRFRDTETGCRVTLTPPDIEWLFQVLNDIRVGSWVMLGSPEKDLGEFELNEATAPYAWAMELAGHFQMNLLEALQARSST
jgi:hypothetical protein